MTPNSFAYIVFLVIGALIYHPLSQKAKKPFLLLLNFMFYAIGGVKFLPLLALTVAFNFFAAQKLERTERKRGLLALVLVLNLGALGLFKYLGFFGWSGRVKFLVQQTSLSPKICCFSLIAFERPGIGVQR